MERKRGDDEIIFRRSVFFLIHNACFLKLYCQKKSNVV